MMMMIIAPSIPATYQGKTVPMNEGLRTVGSRQCADSGTILWKPPSCLIQGITFITSHPHSVLIFLDWMQRRILWVLIHLVALFVRWGGTTASQDLLSLKPGDIAETIGLRRFLLRSIATFVPPSLSSQSTSKEACSEHRYVFISEFPFGRSGNHLVEFTHGENSNLIIFWMWYDLTN